MKERKYMVWDRDGHYLEAPVLEGILQSCEIVQLSPVQRVERYSTHLTLNTPEKTHVLKIDEAGIMFSTGSKTKVYLGWESPVVAVSVYGNPEDPSEVTQSYVSRFASPRRRDDE